jgi:hypothetical protein
VQNFPVSYDVGQCQTYSFERSHALAILDYKRVQLGNVERTNCGVVSYSVHISVRYKASLNDMDLTLYSLNIFHAQVENLVNCITLRAFSLDSGER